jgi:tetratricopeptide (TPR) repeat protein
MLRPKKELKLPAAAKEVLEELSIVQKFEAYWAANKKTVGYIVLAVVLVGVGVYATISRQRSRASEASLALSRVQSYYDAGQFDKAIAGDSARTFRGQPVMGLKGIVDEYGGTNPGKVAALYLANAYYYKGEYDNALAMFQKAEGLSDRVLSAAGFAGGAAVAEAKQQFGEAAKLYDRAAGLSDKNPNAPDYLVSAARCFAKSLQVEKAVELYRRVVFEFAGSNAEEIAKHALAELHVEL